MRRLLAGSGSRRTASSADVSNRIRFSVVTMAGDQVASLQFGPADTISQVQAAVRQLPTSTSNFFCLVKDGAILQADDTLMQVGLSDGAALTLVRLVGPRFELATDNIEVCESGSLARVSPAHRTGWGWATAFATVSESQGVESLSIRLGATAGPEANVTDYFIGALPEELFTAATSQNFLGDRGVGLVLSSHSHWSGSLKVSGGHHGNLFGGQKFQPGDIVSVTLDKSTGTVCFGRGREWSAPIDTQFPQPVSRIRLGVSMYCDMTAGPMRSVEICAAEA